MIKTDKDSVFERELFIDMVYQTIPLAEMQKKFAKYSLTFTMRLTAGRPYVIEHKICFSIFEYSCLTGAEFDIFFNRNKEMAIVQTGLQMLPVEISQYLNNLVPLLEQNYLLYQEQIKNYNIIK